MQLTTGVRREVIEDLLDIRIFSTMQSLLKEHISANKDDIVLNKKDIDSIQEQAERALETGELDINNPESISVAISAGLFKPEQSPSQDAALAKLEMILALIEGWIDYVSTKAIGDRLPSFPALSETLRRGRATKSPTQQLFATLLGLEVSPRKMRECSLFWFDVESEIGLSERDKRWEDPAFLPRAEYLSDVKKFLGSTIVPDDLSGLQ
jgi:putative hydrolase